VIIGSVANGRDSGPAPLGDVSKVYLAPNTSNPVGWTPPNYGGWIWGTSTFRRRKMTYAPASPSMTLMEQTSASETAAGGLQYGICYQMISDPLQAQTLDNTWSFRYAVYGAMSAVGMNFQLRTILRVLAPDYTSRPLLCDHSAGLSPATPFISGTMYSRRIDWTSFINTVNVQAGDRLVMEIGWFTNNTTSSSRFGTIGLKDNVDEPDLDLFVEGESSGRTWMEFSKAIKFA
jgi:hypothetical protein